MAAAAEIARAGSGHRARIERRRQMLTASLSLPALALLILLFALPVLRLMGLSIEAGTLQWYQKALSESLYLQVFWATFRIAAIVTAVSFLLSYPVAYLLATTSRVWAALGFVFIVLPLWTSILVRTYAWMVLLGRNGVFNKILIDLGLTDQPIGLLYNELGVVIGMVHVLMPYMVLPIYSAMKRIDPSLIQAAEGLGAPGSRIFLRIFLPLTAPGIYAGCVLVFVLSLGFFITPALLGGGHVMMIAVLIEQQVHEALNWEFAGALATVLLVATLAIYGLTRGLMRGAAEESA
ncbi:MAG TPA: ABC transporter permease [Stellaceae bacterium]|nr:ABC transporter permease [Stellaceae bacterium]